ncbi:PHP domain-containing protein [Nonomuraea sp. NPDC052265]|uniref:PHP domain-containing protein n=1 Tax=Nonomuraea sp. NPDC052265 TaxID=3364374 RepID=UPI0037C58812
MSPVTLPADSHVHSEWSWDTAGGDMERSCARAVELGLPAIAFTEHVDHTVWTVAPGTLDGYDHLLALTSPDGHLTPPAFDAAGYLEAVERCRERFPELRILSGLEVGEPHRHAGSVAHVLAAGRFDRVLGSLHCLPAGDGFSEPPGLYARRAAAEVVRDYLAEIPEVVAGSDVFSVLAHVDYPVRYWPRAAGPFDPADFEEEFRHALRVTAGSGRALEINTVVPLDATLLRWWREEGGQAVTFGSDAHEPSVVARRFREAAELARAHGFRPGRDPYDFWGRTG